MALPASLLDAVEAHACFTGCYTHETPVSLCIDAARPPVTSFHAACQDCLMFHIGSLASLLPPGMTQLGLARELTEHACSVRGYRWAISGYHVTGQSFWLSAAYYGDGLFLVDGSRNHGGYRDVDLLVRAFKAKLIPQDEGGMVDPVNYASEVVHLSQAPAIQGVRTRQDILRSSQCSLSPRQGLRRVCIVEYLPLTGMPGRPVLPVLWPTPSTGVQPALTPPPNAAWVSGSTSGPLRAPVWSASDVGKVCPKCGRAVKMITILGKSEPNCMC